MNIAAELQKQASKFIAYMCIKFDPPALSIKSEGRCKVEKH